MFKKLYYLFFDYFVFENNLVTYQYSIDFISRKTKRPRCLAVTIMLNIFFWYHYINVTQRRSYICISPCKPRLISSPKLNLGVRLGRYVPCQPCPMILCRNIQGVVGVVGRMGSEPLENSNLINVHSKIIKQASDINPSDGPPLRGKTVWIHA